jgi:hypothetical protein
MKHLTFIAAWVLLNAVVPAAQSASRSLGTSAAADAENTLWIAYAEQATHGAFVQVSSFDEKTKAWRPAQVNREPEPVSAEGENRPKIAFGPSNELYVTWTSPTSAHYTGGLPTRSLENPVPSAAHAQSVRPFNLKTIEAIEEQYRGRAFWTVLWDLECTYCMKSLTNVAAAQAIRPDLRVVTITTDPIEQSTQIEERLEHLGVRSEAYAFSGASVEALRYAIDAQWAGEKPRAYRYLENGERTPISGVIPVEQLSEQSRR